MIKAIIPNIEKIKIPGLIIHSKADQTSMKKNYDFILEKINTKYLETLVVEKAHHNMFDKNLDQDLIFNEVLQF